jgi:hypothetical protein
MIVKCIRSFGLRNDDDDDDDKPFFVLCLGLSDPMFE